MKRCVINPAAEQQAITVAERLLDELDRDMDAQGVRPTDPAAEVLQRLDKDLQVWRRAAKRGRYDRAALGAALRTTHWTRAITEAQIRQVRSGKQQRVTLR
jgi:hypothetical protein